MRHVLGAFLLVVLPFRLSAQDISEMTTSDLIQTYVAIQDELRSRDIATSGNSLTGELGEFLFITAFGWVPAATSQAGFDATDGSLRIQIKARRVSEGAGNEQLGAIRDLDGFDVLAAILFNHDYEVVAAALIPAEVVRTTAAYDSHTNSWRLMFTDALRMHPSVNDVSQLLQSIEY
jgi:hypothetical protein